jgi:hypothetical protein
VAFVVRRAAEADHPALVATIRALNAYENPISRDRDESEAAAHARAAGCARMLIGVLSGNDRAERIYRAAGFRPYALELIRDLDAAP